jgi:hypothetical protein
LPPVGLGLDASEDGATLPQPEAGRDRFKMEAGPDQLKAAGRS